MQLDGKIVEKLTFQYSIGDAVLIIAAVIVIAALVFQYSIGDAIYPRLQLCPRGCWAFNTPLEMLNIDVERP